MPTSPILRAALLAALPLLSACAGGVYGGFPGGAFPAGTCPAASGTPVPVTLVGRIPLVPAEVNGRAATMLLDTGANGTAISLSALERLRLVPGREVIGYARGIAGTVPVTYAPVRQFGFGPLRAVDARVNLIPLDTVEQRLPVRFDGLLGSDLLGLAELDIDLPRNAVTLYPPACRNAAPPFERPPLRVESWRTKEGHLMVGLLVNGQPVPALVDTGAGTTTVSSAVAARLGAPPPPPGARPIASLGVGAEVRDAHFYRVRELRVGEEVIANARIIVSEGLPPGVEAILGADYLMQRRAWMSFSAGRVLFERPAAPGPIMEGTSTLAAPPGS